MAIDNLVAAEAKEASPDSPLSKKKLDVVSESLASITVGMKAQGKRHLNDLNIGSAYVDPVNDDYVAEYLNESQHTDHVGGHGKTRDTIQFKNTW